MYKISKINEKCPKGITNLQVLGNFKKLQLYSIRTNVILIESYNSIRFSYSYSFTITPIKQEFLIFYSKHSPPAIMNHISF
jgi:hypothetical protein